LLNSVLPGRLHAAAAEAPSRAAAPAAKRSGGSIRRSCRVALAAVAERNKASASSDPRASDPRYQEFAKALEKYDFNFRVGDKVTGAVIMVANNGIYVDIGAKSAAFCPLAECSLGKSVRTSELAHVGDRMEFSIIKADSDTKDQIVLLSLRRIELEAAWARVQEAEKNATVYEAPVVSANRGGLVVEVEGIKGFLPASQMQGRDKSEKALEQQTGKKVKVKVLTADPEGGRLVLTSRFQKAEPRQKKSYNVGDVLLGTVQSVQPYGAFVEVPGASGLLHISQVSQERINSIDGVLAVGDKIKVMVLYQEKENGKLSLTTKKLEPAPGDMLRNPKKVFEHAEEMAAAFRERVAVAEAEAAAADGEEAPAKA